MFGRVILNDPAPPVAGPLGGEIGEELQGRMLRALGAHTGPDGRIDRGRLQTSAEFRHALECARLMNHVDLARLDTREARLAFWINAYNALAWHGITVLGVRRSVWEAWNFFGRVSYCIGGITLSLDEIEHGILRANRRRLLPPWRTFSRRDPRRGLALDPPDPRVHFALNCGAASCPPVGVYRAAVIDRQLDLATRNFMNQEVLLDARGRVACSKLFKWYAADFGPPGSLADFLMSYLDEGKVKAALASGARPCAAWRPYSWALRHVRRG